MLPIERNKTLYWDPSTFLSPNQNAPFAGLRDYYSEGKLERALQMGNYGVFDTVHYPGMGNVGVFDTVHYPGMGRYTKSGQLANMDCGCGCNGMGNCLDQSRTLAGLSGLGFTPLDSEDSDILNTLTAGFNPPGSESSIGDTMALVAAADPEPISKIAFTVGSTAIKFINTVESWFGIGAGRREADEITPTQNQLQTAIISPIYAQMANGTAMSCGTIATLYLSAFKAWQQWMHFLHDTSWSDGRAAVQAEATLAPYFNTILGSDSGAAGQYPQGGLEQIFNAKQCGSWVSHPNPVGTEPIPATIVEGGGPLTTAGILSAETVKQYLPYALIGIAAFSLSKIGR